MSPVGPDETSERPVFVYGTLLRGEGNHALLEAAAFLGTARTEARFELLDLGAFPALVSPGTRSVAGELYRVDPATLDRLDRLEGHPRLFVRTSIEVVWERGSTLDPATDDEDRARVEVWVYLLPRSRAGGARPLDRPGWRREPEPG